MENQKVSIKKIALNYGGVWGISTIALYVIAYVTDNYLEQPMWLTISGSAIMLGVIVYGLKAFKLENEGYLSISESLKTGLAISLIAAIIVTLYNYIFTTFIEPEQMMTQNPDMTQEQMDMAMGITEKMMTPTIMAAMGIIFTLFLGFIVSLISGLFMKENRPEH